MKKEDFYHTKWDVRDWTGEMKQLWQEKMFELGFTWVNGGTSIDKSVHDRYYYVYPACVAPSGDKEAFVVNNFTKRYYEDMFPKDINDNETLDIKDCDLSASGVCTANTLVTKPIKSDGGSSSYYDIGIPQWFVDKLLKRKECGSCFIKTEELIEILGSDFDEGNILKCLIRIRSLKNGCGKVGNSVDYDANKIIYSAGRLKERENRG